MREFATGATRDNDDTKPDYEGFLSPLVIERFGAYMTKHRQQADGKMRDSDNWQKGIPTAAYMKSAWRHFIDLWWNHRYRMTVPADKVTSKDDGVLEEALCAILFNVQGYLHEHLKRKAPTPTVVPSLCSVCQQAPCRLTLAQKKETPPKVEGVRPIAACLLRYCECGCGQSIINATSSETGQASRNKVLP